MVFLLQEPDCWDIMVLFHCMVRQVRFTFGGFPLGTVGYLAPGRCFSTTSAVGLSKWLKNSIRILYLNMIQIRFIFEFKRHNFS